MSLTRRESKPAGNGHHVSSVVMRWLAAGVMTAMVVMGALADVSSLEAQPLTQLERILPPPLVATFHARDIVEPGGKVVADEEAWQSQAVVLAPGGPGLTFERVLTPSHYVLHVICRIEERLARQIAPPRILQLRLTRVGDAPGDGETSGAVSGKASGRTSGGISGGASGGEWRTRVAALLSYHDTGHLYFEVDRPGLYRIELHSHKHSRGQLMVEHVDLRDVFGNLPRRGLKTSQNLLTPQQLQAIRSLPANRKLAQTADSAQRIAGLHRLTSDDMLAWRQATFEVVWDIVPPENLHFGNPRIEPHLRRWITDEAYEYQGVREWVWSQGLQPRSYERRHFILPSDVSDLTLSRMNLGPWQFRHPKTGRTYGEAEFFAGQIADDAAVPDDGTGYYLGARKVGGPVPLQVNWLASGLMQQYRNLARLAITRARSYEQTGNEILGWEGLCALIAFVQRYPDIDYQTQRFDFTATPFADHLQANTNPYGKFSSAMGERWIEQLIVAYDQLFPLIQDNTLLASLVGGHVAWVQTPGDVVTLLDTHLLQHVRDCVDRQVIRGHDGSIERLLATAAVVQGVNEAGDWIWQLPFEHADFRGDVHGNLPQQWISNFNANGTWQYGTLWGAWHMPAFNSHVINLARRYVAMGGRLPSELTDPKRYIALNAAGPAMLDMLVAGGFLPRVGNTGSPLDAMDDLKRILANTGPLFENAWHVTHQPAMAWQLMQLGRDDQDDAAWAQITQAAAGITQSPMLTRRSRQLPGLGLTILETPPAPLSDVARQAVVLRTGAAYGASHADTLGLSIFAHHLRVVPDPGRNSRVPPITTNRAHFLVEVDEKDLQASPGSSAIGWTRTFTPLHDITFTAAAAWADSHPQLKRYERRVALIPVGDHQAYTLDRFEVVGGQVHTWTCPGPPADDAAQVIFNIPMSDRQTPLLARYPGGQGYGTLRQGTAGQVLQIDWQVAPQHVRRGQKTPRNDTPPRVDFRAWLMGAQGQPVIHAFGSPGESEPKRMPFNYVHVRRQGSSPDTRSAFVAVLETFTQEKPVVAAVTPGTQETPSPETSVLQVETTSGRMDHLLLGAAGDNSQPVTLGEGITASGEFALVSMQQGQVTQLAVSHGSMVAGPAVSLKLSHASHEAVVQQVDLDTNTLTLDRPLPGGAALQGEALTLTRANKPFDVALTAQHVQGDQFQPAEPLKIYQTDLTLFDEAQGSFAPGMTPVLTRVASAYYDGLPMFNEQGRQVGLARISQGDRWMYLGYPTYWQWKQRLGPADVPQGQSPVTFNLIANTRTHRIEGSTPDGQWRTYPIMPGEKMASLEVTRVREDGLMFWFRQPAVRFADDDLTPSDTRPYGGQKLVTPAGRELIATMPGTQWLITAVDHKLTQDQLPDVNHDGRREISISQAAAGDRISIPTRASAVRMADGSWRVQANVSLVFTLDGQAVDIPLSAALTAKGVIVAKTSQGLVVIDRTPSD